MRKVLPFGVTTQKSQGLLDGINTNIVAIVKHTENEKKLVVYNHIGNDEFYLQEYDTFLKKCDNNLRLALLHFRNKPVNDDNVNSNYRHFKGKWYRLIVIGYYNGEEVGVYKPLYGDLTLAYCRPLDMLLSKTDLAKYPCAKQEYRFMSFEELSDKLGRVEALSLFKEEAKEFLDSIKINV